MPFNPRSRAPAVLTTLLVVVAACAPAPDPIGVSGERDDLVLDAEVAASRDSLVVDLVVRNERAEPVHLVPTQCGRVVDVELERTLFRPEGKRWTGSVQTVKALVLRDQRVLDRPDHFHPRRAADSSSSTPDCLRPERPVTLAPGGEVLERWELPFNAAPALDALGSAATKVTLEVVEAKSADDVEYLDVLGDDREDAARRGRSLRVEMPLEDVLSRDASKPLEGPSHGELFDRLMEDAELREWIEAQPADSWALAVLRPAYPGYGGDLETVQFRLVTKAFERAARVEARPDGSGVVARLPGEESRARDFVRGPGTLPPGIELIPDGDYALTDDLHLPEVLLPSGRVLVGEYLFDLEPLQVTVAPGAYPAHVTLARYRGQDVDNVAFASLVLSDAPTVRWERVDDIAVDGGSTTIVSVEGRDAMSRLFEDDENAWLAQSEEIFDSLAAHDYLATEFPITADTNLVHVSSGIGDGGYPVHVGFDATGGPTRVVVDFYLLHLAWP
ncbi:MAG TPA: DUF4241 domain-containing protein [Clostridia bacterium]|nr:DUF4241 domain-containing protein [Clostridia bacterium]